MLAPHAVPSSPFIIREMEMSDIPVVRQMAEHIWQTHYVPDIASQQQIDYMLTRLYSDEAIQRKLREHGQRFWLLYAKDKLVGHVAIEPRANNEWFIDKLYIDMDTQRKGLGGMLIQHIISEHSPKTLSLRVNRKNYKAVNFYFRHGFVITGLDTLDIGSGFVMADFLMQKNL